jgi:hypothetical protein
VEQVNVKEWMFSTEGKADAKDATNQRVEPCKTRWGIREEDVVVQRGKATSTMGSKERQFAPLINVSLEELIPTDHFYRHLERTLDLTKPGFSPPQAAVD